MAKVAWLGLGVMGYPMAGHLKRRGGHDLVVYNRSAAKAARWCDEFGGEIATTPAIAARGCEFSAYSAQPRSGATPYSVTM